MLIQCFIALSKGLGDKSLALFITTCTCFCQLPKMSTRNLQQGLSWYFRLALLPPYKPPSVPRIGTCWSLSGEHVRGKDVTKLASMCKLKAGRLAREVTDSCLQYWGGMGFTNEVLVSRFYRYAHVTIDCAKLSMSRMDTIVTVLADI